MLEINLKSNSKIKVILLKHSQEPEMIVAQAAKLCYSSVGVEAIAEKLTSEKTTSFVDRLMKLGHFSALEHASFTFGIEGISRALSHQLVRHRLASYSQQSQRYVPMRDFPYVVPPSISHEPELLIRFIASLRMINKIYAELLDAGVPAEDARYLLPNACETKIVVTMNARELIHFYHLRCCNRAQWEIHDLADKMLELTKNIAPTIFKLAGPGCISGVCTEGKMTCGKVVEVREKYFKKRG